MEKLIAIILALVAIAGGGLYYSNNQSTKAPVKSTVNQQVTPENTSNQAALVTTDASIDSDLTALDKDLSSLQQSDSTLTNEVNGL